MNSSRSDAAWHDGACDRLRWEVSARVGDLHGDGLGIPDKIAANDQMIGARHLVVVD